ncbi:T9SS type B sorting domain-containing protein [Tenacibaculum sp. SG-28]|uniref:T9SS type B sorting domain-containing protein n=1 Tax=Tenacibaculum sp. SG-28 TaxID=754426 RepID=UPI000CF3D684|nr:T9SS type B sorting domain-containing protein [Tenacibaculum sp. SG-28]PQJ20745.1 hypothetical protein BSU00_10675 [Tenacibaculum sp. SG-28]
MRTLLLLVTALATLSFYGQKQANYWYFGENAGIDFSTSPPTALSDGALNTLEGCSSFSDPNGNLLFYSDGITVWDKNHAVMTYTNGVPANDLKGNPSSTQSGMIIPKPKSDNIFYLFTVDHVIFNGDGDVVDGGQGLNMYTIDMSLNSGLGQLIDEDNNGSFFDNLSDGKERDWKEKVAAVRGSECDTYWIVSCTNREFYSYKIDQNGLDPVPVISNVGNVLTRRGYLKLSPDGTKLAVANQGNNQVLLYSFNNTTGEVTNDVQPLLDGFFDFQAYGVEFSVTSEKLYVSTTEFFTDDLFNPSNYKLFQFDVTQTDVASTKQLIHQQQGFRGALQLGPDSKIYATIPQTYSNPAGFASFLSVIENPDADANDVVFTVNAIDLNGRMATQGLPPFISSLLLPIEIKDQETGDVVNNETLQFCVGDSFIIAPEPDTGTNVTYEWTLNNGSTTSVISNNIALNITNLSTADAGEYKLTVISVDECNNTLKKEGLFKVEVYPLPIATKPNDINFCDVDNDGFNTFDLQAEKSAEILNGQDPSIFEVIYYTTEQDADNNTLANAIIGPYTNPTAFGSVTIFARIHNILAPAACFDKVTFTINVTGKPLVQTPSNYEECDDITNGGDTDGFYNSFILSTKDSEVLGTLNAAEYEVSYHSTLLGAETDRFTDVIDKNAAYRNTVATKQTIYVRVENRSNSACSTTDIAFDLVVNTLPTVNAVAELKQCDNDTDAFANFNLEEVRSDVSSNFLNETFVFYESLTDAQNETAPIVDPTVYQNKTATSDTVWTVVTNTSGCSRISEVNLTVSTTGIPLGFMRNFTNCDDLLDIDGNNTVNNDDTDGVSSFDFSSVDAEIRNLFSAVGQKILVSYYRNEDDAAAERNAIADITNFRNIGYPNTQNIYIRVDSELDNDCLGFGHHITLNVTPVPIANPVNDIVLCDDFTSGAFDDGINQNIDLSNQISTILGGQSPLDYTVTFHNSASDASTGSNPIPNPSNYENQTPNKEKIYVRVSSNAGGCFNANLSFDILINPLPTISNPIPDIEVCDVPTTTDSDSRNRIAQNIVLGDRDVDVLDGRDPAEFEVSYHRTRQDATDGINPLSKTNYSNDPATTNFPVNLSGDDPATEILFISIVNNSTGCRYGISTLQLVIHPEPNIPLLINNYVDCDNKSDSNVDDRNGINGDITLKNKTIEILANYPLADHNRFEVTFHETATDAQTGDAALDEDQYQNTSNNQTIFVRVLNNQTGCINTNLTFNIIINSLPEFEVDSPVIVCLNNPQTRLEPINPEATYDYVWNIKGDTTILSTAEFLDVSEGGTYEITATTKDGTNCSRTREITVVESINPTLTREDIIIVDDTNNNRLDTYSIKIITENNNLGIGDYQYALVGESGNQGGFQDEPLFENITGGIYTIVVSDKNGCAPDATLDVSVIQYPKFLTPNNDGYNDTWKVRGANSSFYPKSSIYIFDRQGKPIATIPIDGEGWDGTYNGKPLPSNDYWFNIQMEDKDGNVFQHNGHFSLLRR